MSQIRAALALLVSGIIGFITCDVCPDDDYTWICEIEQGQENQTYSLEARVYGIDRQYQLPRGTQLRGRGPGRTWIRAIGHPSVYGCAKYAKNRIGLLLGDDTYIGGFTFRGIEVQRWVDGYGLCGGGAIETPGCADANCAEQFFTGKTKGAGVSNILVENIAIATENGRPTVQVNFWMPRTRGRACNNITVRNLRSNGSWADGLNVHGAHTNIIIENCSLGNSGDDVFAMWSDSSRMSNVTFRQNVAFNPTFPWGASPIPPWGANHVNCFAAYGGSGLLKWLGNRCTPAPPGILPPAIRHQWNDTGMIVFHSNFGGAFDPGAAATIQGNSYSNTTADGAQVRPDFPICNWATGTVRRVPKLFHPHDKACVGVTSKSIDHAIFA